MQKKKIWVLEANIETQMTMFEILQEKYEVIFFEDLSSFIRYFRFSGEKPNLTITNLECHNSPFDFSNNVLHMALAPRRIDPGVIQNNSKNFDEVLFSPFSKAQFLQGIEDLLNKQREVQSHLKLVNNPPLELRAH